MTLPLELALGARVYRRPGRLVATLALVAPLFFVWDLAAVARDHWTFSPQYTTGWTVPGSVPVEEIVFFIVIPICALLTHGTVRQHHGAPPWVNTPSSLLAFVIAAIAFDLFVVRTRVMLTAAFWVSLCIMWAFQVLIDGWLTKQSSPIVIYNENEFSGRRIFFDSPIEDFGFALAMIVLTLSIWERLGQRRGESVVNGPFLALICRDLDGAGVRGGPSIHRPWPRLGTP